MIDAVGIQQATPVIGTVVGAGQRSQQHRFADLNKQQDTHPDNSKEPVTEEKLRNAVEQVNNTIKMKNTSLRVEWNQDTNRSVVSIMDVTTDEVVRQIPAKEFVEWEEAYVELLGILFDKKI